MSTDMEPYLRIGQLSEATGVDATLLRTWEARYGVPVADRTGGGQRRYPAREIERVRAMRRLIDSGYRAAEAARMVQATLPEATTEPPAPLARTREDIASLLIEGDPSVFGILDRLADRVPLEDIVEDVLIPIMREVGKRWAEGTVTVAEEHAATWLVTSWIAVQARNLPPPLHKGLIVTAAPEGERHELGLAMFNVFLRRQGVRVLHLGSDLPAADIARMVANANADALCLAIAMSGSERGLKATVAAMRDIGSDIPIFVGGAGAALTELPDEVHRLDQDMRSAAGHLIAESLPS